MTAATMDVDEVGADKLCEYENAVKEASKVQGPIEGELARKIEKLIEDLDVRDDPVYLGNCLQIIADLAANKYGLNLLEKKNVPEKLIQFLQESDPLIVPHALKLFYRLPLEEFETKYSNVLDIILDNYLQSENNQLIDYAVDLITFVSQHGFEGRKVLGKHPRFCDQSLRKLGTFIISSDSLLKTRTLECIKELLTVQENDPQEESTSLSESFYHSIIKGELKMTNQLLALCRVPFKEISKGAMSIAETIVKQEWGKKEVDKQPELKKLIIKS